jgi:hypothetical protein
MPAKASATAMLDNFCLGAINRFMTPPAARAAMAMDQYC